MTTGRLAVRCPAKVNLVLKVLGRRADGFHELDTVFQAIDLWDEIEIRPAASLDFSCDDPRLADAETNLVARAAQALAALSEVRPAGALHLRKRIPVQAGLGGGSSDAAGALLLCSRFWGLAPRATTLAAIAADLGADVPFFLAGGTARGRGRGERLDPLPSPGPLRLLLGCPPFGLATAEVFRRASARLTLPGIGVSLAALSTHKWLQEKDFGFLTNDLEGVVFEDWPELRSFRDALRAEGAGAALLSGSGSTVYGIFDDDERIARAASRLRERFSGWRILATRAVRGGVRLLTPESAAG